MKIRKTSIALAAAASIGFSALTVPTAQAAELTTETGSCVVTFDASDDADITAVAQDISKQSLAAINAAIPGTPEIKQFAALVAGLNIDPTSEGATDELEQLVQGAEAAALVSKIIAAAEENGFDGVEAEGVIQRIAFAASPHLWEQQLRVLAEQPMDKITALFIMTGLDMNVLSGIFQEIVGDGGAADPQGKLNALDQEILGISAAVGSKALANIASDCFFDKPGTVKIVSEKNEIGSSLNVFQRIIQLILPLFAAFLKVILPGLINGGGE